MIIYCRSLHPEHRAPFADKLAFQKSLCWDWAIQRHIQPTRRCADIGMHQKDAYRSGLEQALMHIHNSREEVLLISDYASGLSEDTELLRSILADINKAGGQFITVFGDSLRFLNNPQTQTLQILGVKQ